LSGLVNGTKIEHKINTSGIGEIVMTDMLQDVAALVSVSVFVVSLAMWIGAY
jgi:hypothetical protein